MTAPAFEIVESVVPQDESPATDEAPSSTADFDPQFPGSTEEAPYGYFPDGRIRKRRPKGSGGAPRSGAMPARSAGADTSARQAAALLAGVNKMIGMSLMSFGMIMTAEAVATANEQFETMAYEALKLDPSLARKILSAGGQSGKTALIMAYGMFSMSIAPVGYMEIKAARAERIDTV